MENIQKLVNAVKTDLQGPKNKVLKALEEKDIDRTCDQLFDWTNLLLFTYGSNHEEYKTVCEIRDKASQISS